MMPWIFRIPNLSDSLIVEPQFLVRHEYDVGRPVRVLVLYIEAEQFRARRLTWLLQTLEDGGWPRGVAVSILDSELPKVRDGLVV